MFLFFSLRQSTRGDGRPDALQAMVAFSPSDTETSPSDVPKVRMSGATARDKYDYILHDIPYIGGYIEDFIYYMVK